MPWARHVDTTHRAIVQALEAIGCSVAETFRVGSGFPDLVVGYRQATHLIECKSPGGRLESSQVEFHSAWRGAPVIVACSPEDAINAVLRAAKERR